MNDELFENIETEIDMKKFIDEYNINIVEEKKQKLIVDMYLLS